METPERIYFGEADKSVLDIYSTKEHDDEVEYVRKDAFIKKACEWLEKNANNYIWYSDYAENIGDDTCGMNDDFLENFENCMKGE